ncbi:MAG: hypothetical protein AAB781_01805 [Patescibacteria group bacterium]
MNLEGLENGIEYPKHIEIIPPPVELLLLDPEKTTKVWPGELSGNKDFIKQVEDRRKLITRLNIIFSRLPRPDTSLEEAMSTNEVTEDEVADLYASLSELLQNPDYRRATLYIPFEFLPNISKETSNDKLAQCTEQFKGAYMSAWHSLLNVQDVRANFVDGDVLETEMRIGDLPRVVKAAHLIPKLVEKGMMTVEDALTLLEASRDEVLKQSIEDTIPVLYDLGFIGQEESSRMQSSRDEMIQKLATEIISYEKETIKNGSNDLISFSSVQNKLRNDFVRIDSVENNEFITEKRLEWLKDKERGKIINSTSDNICLAIQNGKFDDVVITEFVSTEADVSTQESFIEGIRKAIETIATNDIENAKNLYEHYKDVLFSFWQKNSSETKDVLLKTFRRLFRLKIVDIELLNTLEITIPDLSKPFSENLESIELQTQDIKTMINKIETDSELSKYVYPIVIIYGSRLKGYGMNNADIDIAVMIKPSTPFSQRDVIHDKLKTIFEYKEIHGAVTEFWLDEIKKGLVIHDFEKPEVTLGEKWWTHVIFGGVWEGDQSAIDELRKKLLMPYFLETDEVIHGREARELYLEELERDTLQYRLMHKGYERFYPSYGGIHTLHADKIDGDSVFWDSGYRNTAIQLFASRVFLPKISK